MLKFGIRLGKVIAVNYKANTIDVLLEHGAGIVYGVQMSQGLASTIAGHFEMPVLKTVANSSSLPQTINLGSAPSGTDNPDLFWAENNTINKVDFDDNTTNYAYAVVAKCDEAVGKTNAVCLGFVFPFRNQMLFDPEDVDTSSLGLSATTIQAIKQLKGGMFHRTNSGVYWTVDLNGNTEWFHPNGTFFRIGEFPTQDADGTIHVDYTGGNRKATYNGTKTNIMFDTSKNNGLDGSPNSGREVYFHMEVVTAKGTVEIDVDKDTGNLTIQTPKDQSSAEQGSNQLMIVCGGDATLESVQGDVTIQSANQDIMIESANNISIQTDNAGDQSIILAPNANYDYLPLFTKLAQKFNKHTHQCGGTTTSGPSEQLEQSDDATSVTVAG